MFMYMYCSLALLCTDFDRGQLNCMSTLLVEIVCIHSAKFWWSYSSASWAAANAM